MEDLIKAVDAIATPKGMLYCCKNHDVASGVYECPMADLYENTIVCTSPCKYNYKQEFEESLNDEDIVDYPF